MAIIKSSVNFAGSEMTSSLYGATIKPGVRTVNFKDQENKNGVTVFMLPAYKADASGNGVWYKVYSVRDNFGLEIKEKFPTLPANDPIEYFASQCKLYFPNHAAVTKTVKDGRDVKIYPSFGRTTTKVLFNVALFRNLNAGAHVLEVPQYGCADQINAWTRGRTPEGEPNPMLSDYQKAIPVEFRLVQGAKGNPWSVLINPTKVYALPEQLADSDYLYNLDEVVAYPTIEELVEKLRRITPTDIFNKCMSGYSGGNVVITGAKVAADTEDDLDYSSSTQQSSLPIPFSSIPAQPVYNVPQMQPQQVTQPVAVNYQQTVQSVPTTAAQQAVPQAAVITSPTSAVFPAFNLPKAQISQETAAASSAIPQVTVPSVTTSSVANPMAGLDIEQARQFLKKR